jgi:predicted ATPase/DNA-binding SARP family transcriptional activator
VDIEVLGRPAVRVAGERVELKGRQPALFAALVVAAPRPVAAATLLEVIWGERRPRDPANALQQRISELRRTLDPDQTGEVLVTVPGGYALRIDDTRIDARRSAGLAAEGHDLLVAGDLEAARERLDEALTLWRGPAFDGVADEPWLVPEVQRLRELHLTAAEDRLEASLGLGGGAELVPELTDLATAEPLRERPAGQLMRALYRAGRQADALAAYERIRQLLADELGVDPGPQLQRIHLQVLEQADELEVATLSAPRPRQAASNLPAPTRTVIGRDAAIARTGQLLAAARLVTLTGPGGAGKTTVALEAARRHPTPPDGTWLVEFASLTDGAGVPDAVAHAVGVGGGGPGGRGLSVETLADALVERSVLLVLDNCEHLVAAVAELVGTLLARAPGLRVLATSREPLGVEGELLWSLPSLGVPALGAQGIDEVAAAPAVALLVDRIRAHEPTFHLDVDGAAAAATIVRRLDGIPLAIELAAARARVLSLPELATALEDRFDVLASGPRSAPSRQRTLRGAIGWSWDLLDEHLRVAWAVLSVPVDGADRELASALLEAADVAGEPLDVLGELADRSIVSIDTTVTPARYRMLESLRAYGHDRLQALGLEGPVRTRHAEVVREALAACHDDTDPTVFGVDLDGLAAWLDEARAALRWAADADERGRVQQLAGSLGWLWLLRGLAAEGLRWLERGLSALDGAPPADLDVAAVDPAALLWTSALHATAGSPHGSTWATASLGAQLGPSERVLAELFAAVHRAQTGDVAAALADLERAVGRAGRVSGWVLGFAHLVTAQVGRLSGRMDDVRAHAEAGLEELSDAGADWARVQAIDLLVDALDPAVEPERARRLATEGLALCRRRGLPELEGRMLLQLGAATHAAGDPALAASYLEEAVESTRRAGRSPSLGFALLVAGTHARERGELDLAVVQLSEARALLTGTALAYGAARVALEFGRTRLARGEEVAAAACAAEAARLTAAVGDPGLIEQAEALVASVDTVRGHAPGAEGAAREHVEA